MRLLCALKKRRLRCYHNRFRSIVRLSGSLKSLNDSNASCRNPASCSSENPFNPMQEKGKVNSDSKKQYRFAESTDTLLALLDNKVKLTNSADAYQKTYLRGDPFPHLVIDDMFSDELLEPLLTEVARMKQDQWQTSGEEGLQRVRRIRSCAEIGKASQRLVNILHSAPFLYLLSELTGIWQLLPDPYLQGGGNAMMKPGDYFKVHSDRSVAYDTGLTRRLALIVFLNKDWDSAFGGQLELWDNDGKFCRESIEPAFNRTVIFEVKDPNYHGVPTPLACPPDRIRQSFLVYYHTV